MPAQSESRRSACATAERRRHLTQLGGTLIGPRFGFLALDRCQLTPAVDGDSGLPDFVFGGGLRHQWQFACAPQQVTQVRVDLSAGGEGGESETVTIWEHADDSSSSRFASPVESKHDAAGSDLNEVLAGYPSCAGS